MKRMKMSVYIYIHTFALKWKTRHVASTRKRDGQGSVDWYCKGDIAGDNETQTVHASTCEGLDGIAALRCR